jgi:hypothetical protein
MERLDPVDELTTIFTNANLDDKEDTTSYSKPKSRATGIGRKRVDSATSTYTENHGIDIKEVASALPALDLQSQQEADEVVIDASSVYLAQLKEIEAELAEVKAQLKEAQSKFTQQEEELLQAQQELGNAEDHAKDLVKRQGLRKTTTDIQFRKYTDNSNPRYVKFDLVQTFTTLPTYGPDRAVLAYTKIGGMNFLAQNGKHPATLDGIIDGTHYSEEARKLFRLLGYRPTDKDAIFQHAEPQLMALHIERFRNSRSLTIEQFKGLHAAHSGGELQEVEIFVSRVPCRNCREVRDIANVTVEKYGFRFSLKDISIN